MTTLHAAKSAANPSVNAPREERILGVFTPAGMAIASVLGLAFVALFFRWFLTQHELSLDKPSDWGHSYLVPLISGYLIWQKRAELARASISPFWPGLAPFLLGIVAYFFCVVGVRNHMLQGFSIILALFGLVLLQLGPAAMRTLFLPIAFLGFAVTISEMIMIELTFRLQLVASTGAWIVLSALGFVSGFSCDQNGNVLQIITSSGTVTPLNVAEACSGMRMVIAFIALAGAAALLGCRFWWQRAALMLLAVPVAIVVNVGRVAILGLLTLADPNLAAGQAHTLIGTLLLVPGLLLFMLVVWILNRVVEDRAATGVSP